MEENKVMTISGGQVPAFVQEKLNSLAGAMEYANTLLKSGIAPAHFYHKGSDGKPDYTKGKPEAVVIVLQFGSEIGMTPMQALQQLVPVNNLVSLKGDGAKALIQRSGKLASWVETEVGTQGKDDWGFKIEASRKDTGEKSSSTFTVADAKRAGLWIDDSALQRAPGLKHSPWFKHPRRMLKYRALGFISRDLFPDVLSGIYTEEEAADMATDNTRYMTEAGIQVDLTKADNTEQNNAKVAEKIEAKSNKVKNLAGATSERKVITPQPVVEENIFAKKLEEQEQIQTPEVVETKPLQQENTAGTIDVSRYEESLKAMSPKDLGNAFRKAHADKLIPFTVQQWVDGGGSKLPKDLIQVLVAAQSGAVALKDMLTKMGLEKLVDIKPVRDLSEQLEIMDAIEAAGADAELLAKELGYTTKEEMFANGDRETILSKVS